jgi:hypothetical protein
MKNSSSPKKKPLNLAKFTPSPKSETPSGPPAAEGETFFIKRAAAATVEKRLPPAAQETQEFGLPLKEMLGLITYCYARGVFNSAEIARLLKQEPALAKSLGRKLPSEDTIRRFRRRFAGEIEDALETLYTAFPPQDPTLPAHADPAQQGNTAHFQAGSRVHDAIWTDNKLPGRPTHD